MNSLFHIKNKEDLDFILNLQESDTTQAPKISIFELIIISVLGAIFFTL